MGDALLAIVKPGGLFHISRDGESLITEAHHLFFDLGDMVMRITDCRCDQCVTGESELLELPLVSARDLAAAILENEIPYLALAPHPDLRLPLASGEPSRILGILGEFAEALVACGVAVEWVELRGMGVGTWVTTVGYQFIQPDHVVVPGLLGQVVEDRYGICTPGVTALVQLAGFDEPYGYPVGLLEESDGEPGADELEAAKALRARAIDVFEAEHGWTGYLKLGKGRQRSAAEASRELVQLAGWLTEHLDDASPADAKGRWKRIRKILAAFVDRAGLADAQALIDRMDVAREPRDVALALLEDVRAFTEQVIPSDSSS